MRMKASVKNFYSCMLRALLINVRSVYYSITSKPPKRRGGDATPSSFSLYLAGSGSTDGLWGGSAPAACMIINSCRSSTSCRMAEMTLCCLYISPRSSSISAMCCYSLVAIFPSQKFNKFFTSYPTCLR